MKWYWVKTNRIIKNIFSGFIWDFPTSRKIVYLTFDDGPTPEITDWTLDILKKYDAKATFFCIGENIKKHPDLFKSIQNQGHSIGNHTENHINGWNSSAEGYIENVKRCEKTIQKFSIENYKFQHIFRPPYGKVTPQQFKLLKKSNYKVIMWDVLSADFDASISPEKCAEHVIKNIEPGSVVIFHDSLKASKNLKLALSQTLSFLQKNEYEMKAIQFDLEPN